MPQLFSAVIDVARADPIVAHIFRTHFWFTEERLRRPTTRFAALAAQGRRRQDLRQRVQREGFDRRRQPGVQHPVAARPGGRLPPRRREVLQHRHPVLGLPDRHRHHRPRLRRHRGGARRPRRRSADRRLGRLRPAPHRHRAPPRSTTSRWPPTRSSRTPRTTPSPYPRVQYASLQLYIHAVVAGILARRRRRRRGAAAFARPQLQPRPHRAAHRRPAAAAPARRTGQHRLRSRGPPCWTPPRRSRPPTRLGSTAFRTPSWPPRRS